MAKRFELAKKYTEKYKHLLLPCRYCGNTDIRIVSDRTVFTKPTNGWSVCCATSACDCTGVYTHVKDAIETWNRRANEALQ